MTDQPAKSQAKPADTPVDPAPPAKSSLKSKVMFGLIMVLFAAATAGITALLINMNNRKLEERTPFVRLVDVDETSTDPAQWGKNWPRQYDSYKRTVDTTRTRYGGSEAMPQSRVDRDVVEITVNGKTEKAPWLKRMYAGYAFAIDFRDRRGHAYMLSDQEATLRVNERSQTGACLHCHASATTTWRRLGLGGDLKDAKPGDFNWPAVFKGFEELGKKSYVDAHQELVLTPDGTPRAPEALPATGAKPTTREALAAHKKMGDAHPVACIDCHNPKTMELRITRPGFMRGIAALKKKETGKDNYDPNRDATRQEMRTYVCAQCHVEYYCGPKTTLFFPWNNGLKVEEIEEYYNNYKFADGTRFSDWKHGETGAELLKAQHPEFEMFMQGTHAKAGVACADCHMPYVREGAMKVSDHHIRSPLLMINRACQTCHPVEEKQLLERAETIQNRTKHLIDRSGVATVEMLNAIKTAKAAGVPAEKLKPVLELQRKAQWRLDFVASENSMGFHASQESARILAEAIDYARQSQAAAQALHLTIPQVPTIMPATRPVEGITPTGKSPEGKP